MIKPTVGRMVLFKRADMPGEEFAAIIAKVWNARMVNLFVIDGRGGLMFQPYDHTSDRPGTPFTSVRLLQPGDKPDIDKHWCEWMPYQVGQAERADKAEAELKVALAAVDHASQQVKLAREQLAAANADRSADLRKVALHYAVEAGKSSPLIPDADRVAKLAAGFEAFLRGPTGAEDAAALDTAPLFAAAWGGKSRRRHRRRLNGRECRVDRPPQGANPLGRI